MNFSNELITEVERLFSGDHGIMAAAKNGDMGILRMLEEVEGFPFHFIENMIHKYGDGAIAEIKKFLERQVKIKDVYRDNYDELSKYKDGDTIKYSPEFVKKVKEVFPDNPEIIDFAENNYVGLLRLIDEERVFMDHEGMLETINEKGDEGAMLEFATKAKRTKDIAALYSMCYAECEQEMGKSSQKGMGN